jgi:two-component system OmpR family response regulator
MRILIMINDDKDLGKTMSHALASQGFAVDLALEVSDALQKVKEVPFDLVLLEHAAFGDADMLILEGLRNLNYNGAVFIISERGDEASKLWGFQHGADDYLVKPFYISELIARVRLAERHLMHGTESRAHPNVLTAGELCVDLIAGDVRRKDKTLQLRPKEYAILIYLMKRMGQIVTHEEINQQVWNLDFDPQSSRLEAHISRLRAKLSNGFKTSLIDTVPGRGYRLAV